MFDAKKARTARRMLSFVMALVMAMSMLLGSVVSQPTAAYADQATSAQVSVDGDKNEKGGAGSQVSSNGAEQKLDATGESQAVDKNDGTDQQAQSQKDKDDEEEKNIFQVVVEAVGNFFSGVVEGVTSFFMPGVGSRLAGEPNVSGTAYAVLDDAGTLTFIRSEESITTNPTVGSVTDVLGTTHTGTIFIGVETNPAPQWEDYKSSIKNVVSNPQQPVAPTSMEYWFGDTVYNDSLETADLSGINTENVTSFKGLFAKCEALASVNMSNFNTANATRMDLMFSECSALSAVDVSSFDTSNVTNMAWMFRDCVSLQSLDVSNFNTSKVTDMSYMFKKLPLLTSLDLSKFNTENVTDMDCMFQDCRALTSLDLSKFNTSKVTNMSDMFRNCSSLVSLNLSSFDTSQVTAMEYMFESCGSLQTLDLSGFNTVNVQNMAHMFEFCSNITSLDLSAFNTAAISGAASMAFFFDSYTSGGTALSRITFGPNFSSEINTWQRVTEGPGPTGSPYTGNWIQIIDAEGNAIPEGTGRSVPWSTLKAYSAAEKHGTWIKELEAGVVTHTVRFETNGGSQMSPVLVSDGGVVNKMPMRTGYTFAGWYTDEELTQQYGNSPIYSDTTLWAKWTQNPASVYYNNAAGEPYDAQTVPAGETFTPKVEDPTLEGCRFDGWYTDRNATTAYDFSVPVESGATIQLYPKFVDLSTGATVTGVSVTFMGPSYEVVSKQVIPSGSIPLQPEGPTVVGATFDGWYFSDTDAKYEFDTPITANRTLSAAYLNADTSQPQSTFVTATFFDLGTVVSTQTLVPNSVPAQPEAPDPGIEGVVFAGWYGNSGTDSEAYDFATPLSSYMQFLSKYKRVSDDELVDLVALNFRDANSSSLLSRSVVEKGSVPTRPADPVKDGYDFEGWYATRDCSTPFDFTAPASSSRTVYAKFVKSTPSPVGTTGFTLTRTDPAGSVVSDPVQLELVEELPDEIDSLDPTDYPMTVTATDTTQTIVNPSYDGASDPNTLTYTPTLNDGDSLSVPLIRGSKVKMRSLTSSQSIDKASGEGDGEDGWITFDVGSTDLEPTVIEAKLGSDPTPSVAAEGTITIAPSAVNAGSTYEAYRVFQGPVSTDGGQDKASTLAWDASAPKAAILSFLDQNGYNDWLVGDGHANPSLHDNPMLAAQFIAAKIADTTASPTAVAASGDQPRTTTGGSFATGLAAVLVTSGTPQANEATPGTAYQNEQGYYLFVTKPSTINNNETAGTAPIWAAITSTPKAVTEKVAVPTLTKQVQDDASGAAYGKAADANIGQDLPYRLTATMPENVLAYGAYGMTFTDTLPSGMSLAGGDTSSVVVTLGGTDVTSLCSVSYESDVLTVVASNLMDQSVASAGVTLTADSNLVVDYRAHLDADYAQGSAGNMNGAVLTYSADPMDASVTSQTPQQNTFTYAHALSVEKVDRETRLPLGGAQFTIVDDASGKFVAADGTLSDSEVRLTTDASNGTITVSGVDSGSYTIAEVAAPAGYRAVASTSLTITPSYDAAGAIASPYAVSATGENFADVVAPATTVGANEDGVSVVDASLLRAGVRISDLREIVLPLTGMPLGVGIAVYGSILLAVSLAVYVRNKRIKDQIAELEDLAA